MFPLTHYYCTKEILGDPSPQFSYGSIFPDVPVTGIVPWDTMKKETVGYSAFLKEKYPDLIEFSQGMLYHEDPYGIDRFVHGETGYAYVKGAAIVPKLLTAFPEKTVDVAHSFVEYAVEMLIVRKYPRLLPDLLEVTQNVQKDLLRIADSFSKYFEKEIHSTQNALEVFNGWLRKMDFSSAQVAARYYTELTNMLRGTSLTPAVVGAYLTEATAVVIEDYEAFLEEVIHKCRLEQGK